MSIHQLRKITLGVPDIEAAAKFYTDFGLTRTRNNAFATTDGGEQLLLVHSPQRRLMEAEFGSTPWTTSHRPSGPCARWVSSTSEGASLVASDPGTGTRVRLSVWARYQQIAPPPVPVNGRGRVERIGTRPREICVPMP